MSRSSGWILLTALSAAACSQTTERSGTGGADPTGAGGAGGSVSSSSSSGAGGSCAASAPSCAATADCPDPTTPCLLRTCDHGCCGTKNAPDATHCDGGNLCEPKVCKSGVCTPAAPVVCAAIDECHQAGTCSPAKGTCSNPPGNEGASCGGATPCEPRTCQAGVCTPGAPVVCTAIDECHQAGTCDPATGTCSNPSANEGAPCGGATPCEPKTCQSGVCTPGAPVVCTAIDECHQAGTCDIATGACSTPPQPNGTACTTPAGGMCLAGSCASVVFAGGAATNLARSLDLGATWSPVATANLAGDFGKIEVGPGRLVAAMSIGGLSTSTDGGVTWTPCIGAASFPPPGWTQPNALAYLGGRWFFGGSAAIYTSEDGVTWSPRFSDPTMLNGYGVPASVATFARAGAYVIASTTGEGYDYLVRSSDGGMTWARQQMSGATMPGIGPNCSHLWVAPGTVWSAFGGAYCDAIVYNTARVWTNGTAGGTGAWLNVTPVGHYTQDLAYGYDNNGNTLLLGGPGLYVCQKAELLDGSGNVTKASNLPAASFNADCTGWIANVQGTWLARAGTSVGRSADGGASWLFSSPGFNATTIAGSHE